MTRVKRISPISINVGQLCIPPLNCDWLILTFWYQINFQLFFHVNYFCTNLDFHLSILWLIDVGLSSPILIYVVVCSIITVSFSHPIIIHQLLCPIITSSLNHPTKIHYSLCSISPSFNPSILITAQI